MIHPHHFIVMPTFSFEMPIYGFDFNFIKAMGMLKITLKGDIAGLVSSSSPEFSQKHPKIG